MSATNSEINKVKSNKCYNQGACLALQLTDRNLHHLSYSKRREAHAVVSFSLPIWNMKGSSM